FSALSSFSSFAALPLPLLDSGFLLLLWSSLGRNSRPAWPGFPPPPPLPPLPACTAGTFLSHNCSGTIVLADHRFARIHSFSCVDWLGRRTSRRTCHGQSPQPQPNLWFEH